MLFLKNPLKFPSRIILLPLITSVVIPMVIMDIWTEIYHRICFPLCGIPYVKRSSYVKIDRHKLKYLTFLQKIYCIYCGYGNGVIRYWSEISAKTEEFWCGIQHQETKEFDVPNHHKNFTKYGDEKNCRLKYGIKR